MPTPRLIGRLPRDTTTEPRTSPGRHRKLPDDLLRQASRRVEIMALVAGALWILAPTLGHVALYFTDPGDPRWGRYNVVDGIATGCLLISIALYVYIRTGKRNPAVVMDLALVYMVAMAFGIGVLIHWGQPSFAPAGVRPMISWIGPIILITAAIVPVDPRRMLVAGFIAASMDSVGMIMGQSAGLYHYGPLRNVLIMHYPNYLMLGVAVVISHVVSRLGQQVTKEREMGSYRLGTLLGRGGMGEVYLATHRMLARPAAIKLIRPEVLASGDDWRAPRPASAARQKRPRGSAPPMRWSSTISASPRTARSIS